VKLYKDPSLSDYSAFLRCPIHMITHHQIRDGSITVFSFVFDDIRNRHLIKNPSGPEMMIRHSDLIYEG
jgi:hypothetical protein